MTQPRRRFDSTASLGRSIDQRAASRRAELDLRHGLGAASPAAQSTGGAAGGSGGGSDPAAPEDVVSTVRLTDSGYRRQGDIVLRHTGTGSLTEDTVSGDRRFSWTGKTLLDVASLPGSPDAQTVYHRTTDDTLQWHDGSGWRQLAFTGGPLFAPLAAKTSAYTAATADGVLLCSGSWSLGLPAAGGCSGFMLWVRNTGAGTITIDPDGSELINGAASLALAGGAAVQLACDGTAWWSL